MSTTTSNDSLNPPPAPTDLSAAPPSAAAPASNNGKVNVAPEPFDPVVCGVTVVKDSTGQLAGRLQAQVAQQGLIVYPAAGEPLVVRPGAGVKYLGANRLHVTFAAEGDNPPRELTLRLRRFGAYQELLTLDTVAFLNGDISKLNPDYNIPLYLFLPALLPLGLPYLVYHFMVDQTHTVSDRIFELVGAAIAGLLLAVLCVAIAFSEKTRASIRVLACLLFTLLAYGGASVLVGAVPMPDIYTIIRGRSLEEEERFAWKAYPIKEELCAIWLMEQPQKVGEATREVAAGVQARFRKYAAQSTPEAVYELDIGELPEDLRAPYLENQELHQKQFKEDFPTITEVTYNPKLELMTQKDERDRDVFGRRIRGKLPGGETVVRDLYVLKERLYMLTYQAKSPSTRPFYHEQFLGGLLRDGFRGKVSVAAAAGGGGRTARDPANQPAPTRGAAPAPTPSASGAAEARGAGGDFGAPPGAKPAETKPAETKPAETKPTADKPR